MVPKYIGICSSEGMGCLSKCAAPNRYAGTVCQEELRSLKALLVGNESIYPLIATDSSLDTARQIMTYVDYLASPKCAAEVKPFLCLSFFGLCDTTEGVSYQPSSCHCRNLRDNVCADEWRKVKNLKIKPNLLPDCDADYFDEAVPCNSDYESIEVGMSSSVTIILIMFNLYVHVCTHFFMISGFC